MACTLERRLVLKCPGGDRALGTVGAQAQMPRLTIGATVNFGTNPVSTVV